ncbi:DNA-3-methyladenine glycosylase I [Streptococcus suis]|uniref:3-methyladenine DNA glycosylase n=1 Tax=Streptococcus suis TaxID=1307 RepID=A0A0Z8FZF1_STRSU|nr:DNA-3-methyladenine glycosylase I [Streptococcus suis]NQH94676.1 DNA-3-methyladenine glycosylase I [Streptococcus suis]CYU89403.1 3-methyladenine DNA glycosylase [Streptococcus suis]HEM3199099.1 DNA-3-methyladenine glycosylase I [Streptococcus suis 14A]HEM5085162.1 DNA-3-methyladenine glycosylase I [Streptococcus suis]HEP1791862.1 DNA-3-methyladenine glycosylase I [Streptococcus suis]
MSRCAWVNLNNPLYIAYHDEEWGKPLHDEQALFELLCLESYQAGLSWEIVLNKRQAFRSAFFDYDVQKVATMTDSQLESLLANPTIIRHKAKIYATRTNAQAFLRVQEEFGTFDTYLWEWVNFTSIDNPVKSFRELPTKNDLSERISKDLKKRGFKFVGPVCIYSYLQAAGLLNEHEETCEIGKKLRTN